MKNNKEIKKFIKAKRKEGVDEQEIWNILIEAGHEKEEIGRYFSKEEISEDDFESVEKKEKKVKEEASFESLGNFNELNFDFVDCYKDIYKQLIKEEGKIVIIAIVLALIISLPYTINVDYIHIPFVIILFLAGYLAFLYWKAQNRFFNEFTKKNNLKYTSSSDTSQVVGNLFKVGHSRKIRNVITGRYGENKAKFFHYSYSVGSGKHQVTYNFTVLEVFFDDIRFPHMLLQTRGKGVFWGRRHGAKEKNERNIALEGGLNEYFKLFFHDGYGVEATQIFSDEFLKFLKEEKSYFDIELKKDRVYIYDSTKVKKKKDFEELFRVTGRVVSRIAPVLDGLKNDFDALNEYYR